MIKLVIYGNKERLIAHLRQKKGMSNKIKCVSTLKLVQHKIEMFQYIGINEAIRENIQCNDYILINPKW